MLPLVSSAVASSGCLVAEAPEYAGAKKTAPFIQSSSINPSPYELIQVRAKDPPRTFSFRVFSEDVGEELWIAFYRDYLLDDLDPIKKQTAPPSTLDKPHNLSIPVDLDTGLPDGCHQLTVLVMHDSTWDAVLDRPDPNAALTDMSSVTWWTNVRPEGDPNTLVDCPTAAQPSGMQQ